jgi:polysaccharide export outer membrane protein
MISNRIAGMQSITLQSAAGARHAMRLPVFPVLVFPVVVLMVQFSLLAGCAPAQFSGPGVQTPNPHLNSDAVTSDPDLLHPPNRSIYLTPGDLVAVHIFGSLDYAPVVRVTLAGTIQLPLIGVVSVKGLTLDQAENLIAEKLKSSGMYRDPQVTLQITESTNGVITVAGEGHLVLPASSAQPLLEVLAAAGGLPPSASHTITIDRPGLEKPLIVDLGNDPMRSRQINIPLYPGDTVILSKVGVVYMLGEFKIPGVIPIQQNSPLTLLQAASIAGGPLYDGKYQDLRVIRTINQERTLVRVDIKRVMRGKDPDPLLQADDIVYLPTSAVKAALVSGGLNLLVSVANLALISTFR